MNKGYQQAIQNIAWEIFNTAKESEKRGETPEEMFALAMVDPKRKEYWDNLDKIVGVIAETYDVTVQVVQADALVAIMEMHFKNQKLIP